MAIQSMVLLRNSTSTRTVQHTYAREDQSQTTTILLSSFHHYNCSYGVTASMSTQEVQSWTRLFYCGIASGIHTIGPTPHCLAQGNKPPMVVLVVLSLSTPTM